jgi:hypothetical protein
MSKIIDIESGTREPTVAQDACVKVFVILVMSIFVLPFGIASVYYAYTDNSCVNLAAGKLYINLKDYLAVNGIMYLIHYCICLVATICFSECASHKNLLFVIVKYISTLFAACWNITGAIIFWKLIDNDKCSSPIYNYVYALMVIQFVFTAGMVLDKTKSK